MDQILKPVKTEAQVGDLISDQDPVLSAALAKSGVRICDVLMPQRLLEKDTSILLTAEQKKEVDLALYNEMNQRAPTAPTAAAPAAASAAAPAAAPAAAEAPVTTTIG
jgi:hypothetical protein